jgi:amino acid permease
MDNLDLGGVRLIRATPEFFNVLPIISFSFSFHTNILLMWKEMTEFPRETKNIGSTSLFASLICFVIYLLCALFGYISFADCTTDNILTHFDEADWYFDIGRVGYALIIMVSYPLLAYPFRISTDSILHEYWWKSAGVLPKMSTKRLFITSLCIFVFSYLLAILPIGIGLVFGITGATAGNLLMFGLPCMFYLSLEKRYRLWSKEKLPALALLILSFGLTVTGLFSAIAYRLTPGLDEGLGNTGNCSATLGAFIV